jgi:hypothetical protein
MPKPNNKRITLKKKVAGVFAGIMMLAPGTIKADTTNLSRGERLFKITQIQFEKTYRCERERFGIETTENACRIPIENYHKLYLRISNILRDEGKHAIALESLIKAFLSPSEYQKRFRIRDKIPEYFMAYLFNNPEQLKVLIERLEKTDLIKRVLDNLDIYTKRQIYENFHLAKIRIRATRGRQKEMLEKLVEITYPFLIKDLSTYEDLREQLRKELDERQKQRENQRLQEEQKR